MDERRPKTEIKKTKKMCTTQKSGTMTRNGNRTIGIVTYKRPKTNLFSCLQSNFGKDSPHITIGCSRVEPVFGNRNPGPGAYTPKDPGEYTRIPHKIPKTIEKPKRPDTADIDFINYRMFPKISPMTICKEGRRDYFSADPSVPGPEYNLPSTFSKKGHKIEPIRQERSFSQSVPGPGYYNPRYNEEIPGTFFYSAPPKQEEDFKKTDAPGPGSYNPNFYAELTIQPRWSIGKKGRFRRRRKCDPPVVPKGKLIGIANFLVQLEPTMEESDVLKYVANHPEMKTVINEIVDQILLEKPDDPVGAIRNYFQEIKDGERW